MQQSEPLSDKTHVRCKVIVEVLGKPKEHVAKSIRQYVEKIKDDSELIVLKTDFAEPKEQEELWSTFADMEMVVKGIPKLIAFCFDYMPSSIQIVKPEELKVQRTTVEDFINDLQARLHQVDMIVKKQKNENDFLRKNMNSSIKNIILLSLASGNLDEENLSKLTGIHDNELKLFLENLINDKKIKEDGGIYSLVPQNKNAQESD